MKTLVLIMTCVVFLGCQPKSGNPVSGFSIQGEVNKPGEYELSGRIPYVKALSMAGGYTTDADANVTIKRGDTEIVKDMMIPKSRVELSTAETFLIEPGDIITVSKKNRE
jgi:protein involved in polysaccharide export with SLBB domain